MKISTIAFDAYGTLCDTADGSVRATRAILLKCGSQLDASEVYGRWKMDHQQTIANLAAFIPEAKVFVAGLSLTYKDFGVTGCPEEDVQIMLATLGARQPFPDALACLDRLRGTFDIVIASNTDSGPLLANLRSSQLVIDKWFTSESLRAYKPHRAFYDRMLSALGRNPQDARDDCAYFGIVTDTKFEIQRYAIAPGTAVLLATYELLLVTPVLVPGETVTELAQACYELAYAHPITACAGWIADGRLEVAVYPAPRPVETIDG